MTDELERCTAAGMDALLVKPLELPRLCEMLDRYGFRPAAPEEAQAVVADVQVVETLPHYRVAPRRPGSTSDHRGRRPRIHERAVRNFRHQQQRAS